MEVYKTIDDEPALTRAFVHAGSPSPWYGPQSPSAATSPSPFKGEGRGEGVSSLATDHRPLATAYVDDHVVMYKGCPGSDISEFARFYYHADGQYNSMVMTDNAGDVAVSYVYSAYGLIEETTIPGGSDIGSAATVNTLLYQGLSHDVETGLHHNRMRVLHSQFGRHLQRDPAGYADSASLYEYEVSLPTMLVDPDGLMYILPTLRFSDWRNPVRSRPVSPTDPGMFTPPGFGGIRRPSLPVIGGGGGGGGGPGTGGGGGGSPGGGRTPGINPGTQPGTNPGTQPGQPRPPHAGQPIIGGIVKPAPTTPIPPPGTIIGNECCNNPPPDEAGPDGVGWVACCKDRPVVCLGPQAQGLHWLPQMCVIVHEAVHVGQLPVGYCKNKPDGTPCGTKHNLNLRECQAFRRQKQCLEGITCDFTGDPKCELDRQAELKRVQIGISNHCGK